MMTGQEGDKKAVRLIDVSRVVSHALRHEPWLYELELDSEGWAPVEDVLAVLRSEQPSWCNLTVADLERMIAESSKRRHELCGGRIRALYGHSYPGKLHKVPATPPAALYHGTTQAAISAICQFGLLPMQRQYVHLSVDEATALNVGRRKAAKPIILKINSGAAYLEGVPFYAGNEKIWLADSVPPQFIVEAKSE